VNYRVNTRQVHPSGLSLVDRGANGGVAGGKVRVLAESAGHFVSLTGLDNQEVPDLPICTVAGYGCNQNGPAILIMHQYAYLGQGKTIHLSSQFESFGIEMDNQLHKVPGGKQWNKTPDGYLIPLDIVQGLPYLKMRPPTNSFVMDTLTHIVITLDNVWDPGMLDKVIDDNGDDWFVKENHDKFVGYPFDDWEIMSIATSLSCNSLMLNMPNSTRIILLMT
jgi:hypothetical protein